METAIRNEAIARTAIEEIWNHHNEDAVDVFCAANYVAREPKASGLPGRNGLKQMVSQARAVAPDVRVSIRLTLARGDRVAVGYSVCNGHRKPEPGVLHMRFVRGQIRESWGAVRLMELLQRAGGVPEG